MGQEAQVQLVCPHTSTWSQKHQAAICTLRLAYWAVLPHRNTHTHKDPGFDSKKSKRGWGWKWNKTSCEQFISEARWWKHEACYIFLFSPSKKRKLRSHMDLALHFLLFLKPCKGETGSWGQCFSRKTPGIPRSLGQEGGQTVSRCPAQAGLLSSLNCELPRSTAI